MSLEDCFQTEVSAWAGPAPLGVGKMGVLGQTVTRVARGEEASAAGQDYVVFLEVCHKFMTERRQRNRREYCVKTIRRKRFQVYKTIMEQVKSQC